MGSRYFCNILLVCLIGCLHAKELLYEYAKAQTNEISPDILCLEETNHISCKAKDIEWVDGLFVKTLQYDLRLQNNVLTRMQSFELQAQNLNFEGYNLAALVPQSILCVDKISLADTIEYNLYNTTNMIQNLTECTLNAQTYNLVVHANFITSHPMYKESKNILEALMIEHERFIQPLNAQQENTWKKHYQIYPKTATLWLTSRSLHTILFELYKRERHIATNETPQNDTNYKAMDKSILLQEYKNFLRQGSMNLQTLLQSENITQNNQLTIKDTLDALIQAATEPNQNLSITLASNKDFTLSLEELENLTNIDTPFLQVITKILKNTTVLIAK